LKVRRAEKEDGNAKAMGSHDVRVRWPHGANADNTFITGITSKVRGIAVNDSHVHKNRKGETMLRTYGTPIKLRLKWASAASGTTPGYRKTKNYRT
jgi:hypothetical protein